MDALAQLLLLVDFNKFKDIYSKCNHVVNDKYFLIA